jgi:hypothetical protein
MAAVTGADFTASVAAHLFGNDVDDTGDPVGTIEQSLSFLVTMEKPRVNDHDAIPTWPKKSGSINRSATARLFREMVGG